MCGVYKIDRIFFSEILNPLSEAFLTGHRIFKCGCFFKLMNHTIKNLKHLIFILSLRVNLFVLLDESTCEKMFEQVTELCHSTRAFCFSSINYRMDFT